MPPFKRHIFICENEREPGNPKGCCMERGAGPLRELFKAEIKRHGLVGEVRANRAGCLDACEYGPTVVVYPDAVWYWVGSPQDVKEIVERHIVGGEVVERLLIPFEASSPPGLQEFLDNLPMARPKGETS